jgi:hypothetical protein
MQTASTAAERERVVEFWIQYIKPAQFPDLIVDGDDGVKNGRKIATYVEAVHHGHWKPDTVTEAVRTLQNNLIGLGVATEEQSKTRAQRAAEAAAEAKRIASEQAQIAIIKTWLRDHAPRGLLTVEGILDKDDSRRVEQFIERNYTEFSIDALNEAVMTLAPTLTWMCGPDSEDRKIRNYTPPAKPPRKLTRQAQIDAGMIPAESERVNHSKSDGHLKASEDLIKFMAKEELLRKGVTSSPIMAEADAIVVQNRRGRVDAGKTAEVRNIIVYSRPGVIDEIRTLKARNKAAEQYERDKNQI